ncbi:hypothetical protein TcBrA4_0120880 [Trypanosoma cruzi]|nr:hypothetical protein TcBrA4_0120880 [Trypanosoma cruzi]
MTNVVLLDDALVEMEGDACHLLYREEDTGVWKVAFVTPQTVASLSVQAPPTAMPAGDAKADDADEDALEFFSD